MGLKKGFNQIAQDLNEITKEEGVINFSKLRDVDGTKDEISFIQSSLNNVISDVKKLLNSITVISGKNAELSEAIRKSSATINSHIEEESAFASEATEKGKYVKVALDKSVDDAVQTKDNIKEAATNLEFAKNEVESMISDLRGSIGAEITVASRLRDLSNDAREIKMF